MKRAGAVLTKCYAIDVRRYRDALRDAVELSITTRGVLFALAQWMNTDGTNARPRLERLVPAPTAYACQAPQRRGRSWWSVPAFSDTGLGCQIG